VEKLIKLQINEHMRLITLDTKDMYVNLPISGIIQISSFWLNKHLNQQVLNLRVNTIIKQNYFQYENQTFQPEKGVAMGSHISSTIAEVYLQYLENIYIKHWLESKEIIFYSRYVDDVLILYDQQKLDENMILYKINELDRNLQFKISTETKNTINYLDLLIHRNSSNITIRIYRKPTETDTVIHTTSNHPHEQKLPAFYYYINRLVTLLLKNQNRMNGKQWLPNQYNTELESKANKQGEKTKTNSNTTTRNKNPKKQMDSLHIF
jgi:hypothetical protein